VQICGSCCYQAFCDKAYGPAETALTPHHSLRPALGDVVAGTDFVAARRAHHIALEETAAARSD
jgi:hypothetical protein